MLRAVNRSIQSSRDLPRAAWFTNILVEMCLPGLALVFFSEGTIEAAYKPLANPAVLFYFIFIILSTLRLDPNVSQTCGESWPRCFYLLAARISWLGAQAVWRHNFAYSRTRRRWLCDYGGRRRIYSGCRRRRDTKAGGGSSPEAETQHQVERLRHDLEIARSSDKFPPLPAGAPEIEGFEIAGWNLPADQTGGDYYDWHFLPNGKLLVALGDATGHGIGPALLSSVCLAPTSAQHSHPNSTC